MQVRQDIEVTRGVHIIFSFNNLWWVHTHKRAYASQYVLDKLYVERKSIETSDITALGLIWLGDIGRHCSKVGSLLLGGNAARYSAVKSIIG